MAVLYLAGENIISGNLVPPRRLCAKADNNNNINTHDTITTTTTTTNNNNNNSNNKISGCITAQVQLRGLRLEHLEALGLLL